MRTTKKPSETPSPTLVRTFREIQRYIGEHGYPPSSLDLNARIGLSRQAFSKQIIRLKRLNYITYTPGVSRSISIVRDMPDTMPALPIPRKRTQPKGARNATENRNRNSRARASLKPPTRKPDRRA